MANSLLTYLIGEVFASKQKKINAVRAFYPQASANDWRQVIAGQRVQLIKPVGKFRGVLQFGTEVVVSEDGSMAGLLGASPGASTAVSIALETIERAFPAMYADEDEALTSMIKGRKLSDEDKLVTTSQARKILDI